MTISNAPHVEAHLQQDMDAIRARLLEMLALDERALTQAFDALVKRDRQLAYSVILRDQDIDALETELDQLCLEFIVRHQPAAAHLRFVYSASKIISQLERVGDYAESIARQVLLLSSIPLDVPMDDFAELARLSIPMLRDAVRAFADRDGELARATMLTEPRVNHIRDLIISELVNWRVEARLPLEALTPLVTVARRFERVSDQATNICEQALYFATGEYVRHTPRVAFKILFVDANHGSLSRLAEAAGKRLAVSPFAFASAGIGPEPPDERTAEFLAAKGVDVASTPPRSLDSIEDLRQFQVLVALDAEASNAVGQGRAKAFTVEWLLARPDAPDGAAYEETFDSLTTHIRDLMQAILGTTSNPKP